MWLDQGGRWNNNPTAAQFRAAYRMLLMKHEIKPSESGNAVAQEHIDMLSGNAVVSVRECACTTADILTRYKLCDNEIVTTDHSYAVVCDKIELTEFSASVVTYIAGRVAMKLCKKLVCQVCKDLLLSQSKVAPNSLLLTRKDAGGLTYPSDSVVTVCRVTEQTIRFINGCCGDSVPTHRKLLLAVQVNVVDKTSHLELFPSVSDEHSCSVAIFDSVRLNLTRLVVNTYCNIRMYAVAKSFTDRLRGLNVRSKSNKGVLFMHQ